jgi:hypothetical protein
MKDIVIMLLFIGALVGVYTLILCKTAAKPTPKPGKQDPQ